MFTKFNRTYSFQWTLKAHPLESSSARLSHTSVRDTIVTING